MLFNVYGTWAMKFVLKKLRVSSKKVFARFYDNVFDCGVEHKQQSRGDLKGA